MRLKARAIRSHKILLAMQSVPAMRAAQRRVARRKKKKKKRKKEKEQGEGKGVERQRGGARRGGTKLDDKERLEEKSCYRAGTFSQTVLERVLRKRDTNNTNNSRERRGPP